MSIVCLVMYFTTLPESSIRKRWSLQGLSETKAEKANRIHGSNTN